MSTDDRQTAIELVEQAVTSGARRAAACGILGISLRTLERWKTDGGTEDRRHGPTDGPANALCEQERALVISI